MLRTRKVLAIDGGGIRGILPATLLDHLEARLGKTSDQIFDMVSGTSTGGIIASGIFRGIPSLVMLRLYTVAGGSIFKRSILRKLETGFSAWAPRYDPSALEYHLERTLGITKLSAPAKTELIIPTYCVKLPYPMDLDGDGVAESASPVFFSSWMARKDPAFDFDLPSICRATSAAPTYFPAAAIKSLTGARYLCVDGGVYANNPAALAYDAAHQMWPDDEIKVVSLGTGSKVKPLPGSGQYGALQWAPKVMSVAMDGASDTITYDMASRIGKNFVRVQLAIQGANEAFDDASPDNIKNLQKLAERYTTLHIDAVVNLLK